MFYLGEAIRHESGRKTARNCCKAGYRITCLMGIYRKKAVYRSVRVVGANLRDRKRSYLLVRISVPPQSPTFSLYRASDGSTIFVLMASLLLTSYRFTFANSPFMDKVPSS